MKLPKKISELPSVSTIKNADLFAIVQDGVTSNVTFTILEGVISGYTASADTYVTGGVYNSGTTSIDFTGNTDFPPFSVDVSDIGGIFTGNTSATCISDIYVSNIHSCSPLNINPLKEGNIFIGTGFTFDLTGNTDQRLGINTSIPQANLHIKGLTPPSGDTLFLLEDSVGNVVIGANDEGALSIGVDPYDISTSGSSSLFIKGDSSTSTGNSDDENIALRVMNSTNQDILLVKNGGRVGASGNIQDGRVGINCAFHSGGPFLPDDTIFYVRGDDAGVSATGDAFKIADADTNTMVIVQNNAAVLLSRSIEYGKVKIGGENPAAKLHISLPDTWQDTYGETLAVKVDGLSDVAPFTANTSNIFTIDNFGNTNILKRTTTENFTMTSGGTNNYILTSDASGNASWQEHAGASSASCISNLFVSNISGCSPVTISSDVILKGGITRNTRNLDITIVTDHPLTSSDDIIFLTTSSGGDIVLPAAASNNGRVIEIIRVSGTDSIRVGDDTANVNGTASPGITLSSTLYSKNTFTCDGSNWFSQTSSP